MRCNEGTRQCGNSEEAPDPARGHPERLPGGGDVIAKIRRVSRSERGRMIKLGGGGDMGHRKSAPGRGNSKCKGWEKKKRVAHSRN